MKKRDVEAAVKTMQRASYYKPFDGEFTVELGFHPEPHEKAIAKWAYQKAVDEYTRELRRETGVHDLGGLFARVNCKEED